MRSLLVLCLPLALTGCSWLSFDCASRSPCPEHTHCSEGLCLEDEPPPPPPPPEDVPDAGPSCPVEELGLDCVATQGQCTAAGVTRCASGVVQCGGAHFTVSAEVCDGLDNDCDGDVDEELPPQPCLAVPGVCVSERTCQGTAGWSACTLRTDDGTDASVPEETKCDGVDNDCNGVVDDVPGCFLTLVGGTPGGRVDGATGVARLLPPSGAAMSADGTVWFSQTADNAVRVVRPDGTVSTLVGDPLQPYTGPYSMLGVATPIHPATRVDGPAATARLYGPKALVLTENEDALELYESASIGNARRRIATLDAGPITVTATLPMPGYSWAGLAAGGDGGLATLEQNGSVLTMGRLGAATQTFRPTAGFMPAAGLLAADALGSLYVADRPGQRVLRRSPDGGDTVLFSADAGLGAPSALAVTSAGDALLVADVLRHVIWKVSLATPPAPVSVFAGAPDHCGWSWFGAPLLCSPTALAVNGPRVVVIDAHAALRCFGCDAGVLAGDPDVARDSDAGVAALSSPGAITRTNDGVLWWLEPQSGVLRTRNPSTGAIRTVNTGFLPLDTPTAVTAGPDGRVYLAEQHYNVIRRYDPVTDTTERWAGVELHQLPNTRSDNMNRLVGTFDRPSALDMGHGPDGGLTLWVGEEGAVRSIDLTTGELRTFAVPDAGLTLQNVVARPITAVREIDGLLYAAQSIYTAGGSDPTVAVLFSYHLDGSLNVAPLPVPPSFFDGRAKVIGFERWNERVLAIGERKVFLLNQGQLTSEAWTFHTGASGPFETLGISGAVMTPDGLVVTEGLSKSIRRLWVMP